MSNFTTQFSGSLIDTKMADTAMRGDSQLATKRDPGDEPQSFARELSKANDQQRSAETRVEPGRRQRTNAHSASESSSEGQRTTSQSNDAQRKSTEDPRVARAAESSDEADVLGTKPPGAESQERLTQSNLTEVDSPEVPTGKQTAHGDDGLLTPKAVAEGVVNSSTDKLAGSDKAIDAADVDFLAGIPDAAHLSGTGVINSGLTSKQLGKANAASLSNIQAKTRPDVPLLAAGSTASNSLGQIIGSPTSVIDSAVEPEASIDKLPAVSLKAASSGATGQTSITAKAINAADTAQAAVGTALNNPQLNGQQRPGLSSPTLNVAETASSSVTVNQLRQFSAISSAKPPIPGGETVVADEVLDTAQTSILRSVKSAADLNADGSAMREKGSSRSMDMLAFSQRANGEPSELSASQLRVDQLTALSTRTGGEKATEATLPGQVVEANVSISESELSAVVKPVLKSGVQSEGALGLGGITTNVASSSLADNMLVDSSSGIVTAPVLTRTDTVSTQVVSTPLPVPLMSPAANEAMTSNINWMVKEGVQNASVNVMPAGMGPISVNIGIENEQMNVSIVATQGTTREALEALLPRLREQLLTQGHDSVRVEISDGKSDQARGNNAQSQNQNQNPAYERASFGGEQSTDRNSDQSHGHTNEQTQSGNERLSSEFGERPLTDAERARVASLQEGLSMSGAGSTPIQHGYDLYV